MSLPMLVLGTQITTGAVKRRGKDDTCPRDKKKNNVNNNSCLKIHPPPHGTKSIDRHRALNYPRKSELMVGKSLMSNKI